MVFSSHEFILFFLPLTFAGYFFLLSRRLVVPSRVWLVASSLFFYAWWNPAYLQLILLSMMVNYALGTSLGQDHTRISKKALLVFGIVFNLGLLGYFKYTDFLISNFNGVFGADVPLQNILLPLAISFFTFQQIAYLVDSYKKYTREYDILSYMLFVTFFPQLIAGPIVHHKEMMPQFSSRWNLVRRPANIVAGLVLFTIGLFKKVVIADQFAVWANIGFDDLDTLTIFEAWVTSLSYTFQLYFDFSGYTDMALGVALLFNIRLPVNFNSPYKALSIQDFWRRWHMTLSRFLRDYLYIPLGGNRLGAYRTHLNLFATFLLGGLWHGASWMFVIWGSLHGLALIVHRVWSALGIQMWRWLAWLMTFNFINVTWVFFRAESVEDAMKILRGMMDISIFFSGEKLFKLHQLGAKNEPYLFILASLLVVLMLKNSNQMYRDLAVSKRIVFLLGVVFCYVIFSLFDAPEVGEFLYFNF